LAAFTRRCGHLFGDECLRIVAKTLSQQLGRSSDPIARFAIHTQALQAFSA
jgi:PleD family two-component response regulator